MNHTLESPLPIYDQATGRMMGYLCRTGRHEWSNRDDANKCCNPKYRRVQRVIKNQTGFGITYCGLMWAEVPTPPTKKKKGRSR